MLKNLLSALVCFCLLAGAALAQNGEQEYVATARKTMQKYEKAVITLSAVLKIEVRGVEAGESKSQFPAVVIDQTGMAVASLTNLSPHGKVRAGGRTVEVQGNVQEVKYRLADGSELPARVVLKDEDLDLAFLMPQKPLDEAAKAQLAAIPLADAASQVQPMDATILLGRANEDLNYAPLLIEGRILALITQPRNCYVADGGVLGMPVFNAKGKLIGMLCRCVKNEGENTVRMSTVSTQLILPAADIARLVPQAKEEAKKAAELEKKPAKSKKKGADAEKKAGDKKATEKKDSAKK
ncbi:MAG: serine protease [Planctomycetaceae bacterium]|nr:serine protease [Planctomycetaceae bacterium]